MFELGNTRSAIREIFEYSKRRGAEIGAEKVFDFSIGNPNVPAPAGVGEAIRALLAQCDDSYLHGYTSAQGDADTRKVIADDLNERYKTSFGPDNLYLTCGAAASLTIALTALYEAGDEVIVFAPYFPEYRVFIERTGAKMVVIPCDPASFQIDIGALAEAINVHTKAVIVNSPNNPSGVVYTKETIRSLAGLLTKKSGEYGRPIFLLSDEPYRELAYDVDVPFLTNYYDNTIVSYSFSKSLSLPGERIGYLLVPDAVTEAKRVYLAVCGAARALGFVCAPSLFQHVIARVIHTRSDIGVYRTNRDLLYHALTDYGFTCVYPRGAFYLFLKSPEADAGAFCERAKQLELLLVPGDSFGCPGYVRISYCVQTQQIRDALPAFRTLAASYRLQKQ